MTAIALNTSFYFPSPLAISEHLDKKAFIANYHFAKNFKEKPHWTNAIHLSFYCLASAFTNACNLVIDTSYRLVTSIWHMRNCLDNPQLTVARVAELIRDIAGTFFSTPVGLIAPSLAVRLFHVKDDRQLTCILTKERTAKLYAIGAQVTHFCDSHNIDYRMTAGTFLGAIRHRGIIPWDDDIDLFLAPNAKQKFEALLPLFTQETGLAIRWNELTGGWQAYFADGEIGSPVLGATRFPFLDLFCTVEQNGSIFYELPLMKNMSPNELYTRKEWDYWVPYKLGPLEIKGPLNPYPYFDRAFGRAALNFAYQLVHHFDFKPKGWPQRVFVRQSESAPYDKDLFRKLLSTSPSYANLSPCLKLI